MSDLKYYILLTLEVKMQKILSVYHQPVTV